METPNTPAHDHARRKVTQTMVDELDGLINTVSPTDVRETLIEIFFRYVALEAESGFPDQVGTMALHLHMLLEFLDSLEHDNDAKKP